MLHAGRAAMAAVGRSSRDCCSGGRRRYVVVRRRAFIFITVISIIVDLANARYTMLSDVDDSPGWMFGGRDEEDLLPAVLLAAAQNMDSSEWPWRRRPLNAMYSRHRRKSKPRDYKRLIDGIGSSWKRRST